MPIYKVLVKNKIEIGKFTSEDGILTVSSPTKNEIARIENAISSGLIKEQVAKKPTSSATEK